MAKALNAYDDFIARVDKFVSTMLVGYKPQKCADKAIHDPIWGSALYYYWEIQLIDSPLLQRLRNINQVGLALLTYPSARHSRFEHSLGVVYLASEILETVRKKSLKSDGKPQVTDDDIFQVRLAALLHDVGHCFYSHLSEAVYGSMQQFRELIHEVEKFNLCKPKPHEIFSYLIVNCPSFKDFFMEYIDYPLKGVIHKDRFFEEIGDMIIGKSIERRERNKVFRKNFLTNVINGAFDADKLDYIRRDSYIAGLSLTYDIERFLYKVDVEKISGNESIDDVDCTVYNEYLVIPVSGLTSVEELTFSRLMLYSYIYHHQKVLAADSLAMDFINGMLKACILLHPCDYLNYSDCEIEKLVDCDVIPYGRHSQKTIGTLIKRLIYRQLPKRSLVINCGTVDDDGTGEKNRASRLNVILDKYCKKGTKELCREELEKYTGSFFESRNNMLQRFERIYSKRDDAMEMDRLRERIFNAMCDICEALKKSIDFDMYDIHVVIPKSMSISKDVLGISVITQEGQMKTVDDIMKLSNWAESFASNKWNTYVYCRGDLAAIAHIAARRVLSSNYGIKFNHNAYYNLKNFSDIIELEKKLASSV